MYKKIIIIIFFYFPGILYSNEIIQKSNFLKIPYQKSITQINCAPLQACDITLPEGEKIKGIYLGDSMRWMYEIAESGEFDHQQFHIIFKPQDENLYTNLVITGSRNTYHIQLKSTRNFGIYQTEFYDAHLNNKDSLINLNLIDVDMIDLNYYIKTPFSFKKSSNFMPVQVLNNGKYVFIKMKNIFKSEDAPVLFLENNDGQRMLANYRVYKNFYIVEQLFKKAVLVTGVGKHQKKIEIIYKN